MKRVLIRALRTMAQTLAGLIGTYGLMNGLDWLTVASVTLGAGIVCILMHLGNPEDKENPHRK